MTINEVLEIVDNYNVVVKHLLCTVDTDNRIGSLAVDKLSHLEEKLTDLENKINLSIPFFNPVSPPVITSPPKNKKTVPNLNKFNPQKDIVNTINTFAATNNKSQETLYNLLYDAYELRYKQNIKQLSKSYNPSVSVLTYATRHDQIEKLHMLCILMFKN